MRVVTNIATKTSTRMLARLNKLDHLLLASIIQSMHEFETADAPIGTRHLQVLVHEEADSIWIVRLVHLRQVLKVQVCLEGHLALECFHHIV